MLKLASWNVNSLKMRLEHVLTWLELSDVDVLALQETKCTDENFPEEVFTKKGLHVAFSGQKMFNGVAIISRHPITETRVEVPGLFDPQRRVIMATIKGFRLINLYVPNGAELTSEKYRYKLDWLEKVSAFIKSQLALYPRLAIVGDFNIAPEDRDVHDPAAWEGCVLVSEPERQAFRDILAIGFADSFRNFSQEEKSFSWWDYRAAGFRRNLGLRIDHLLLSQELNVLCKKSEIDKTPRKWDRPSDHAPVWVELEL